MNEKETYTTEHDDFIKKAALTAAGVSGILIAGAWGVGQAAQNEQAHTLAQETANAQKLATQSYNNSVDAAINAHYDNSQVIGEFNITEGMNLIDPAVAIAESELGNEIALHNYSPLLDSAKSQNPQPGETYAVVSADINPAAADGTEFIVVNSDNINQSEIAALPSPIIADGSSNESQN